MTTQRQHLINKIIGLTGFVFFIFLSASSAQAGTLRWSAVTSSGDCVIAGYIVHYGIVSGEYPNSVDVGNVTSYNLSLLPLDPAQTYYIAVNAYSDSGLEGPLSEEISYRDSPEIVGIPSVDFDNGTIDITFSESGMQGAFTKGNYSFSPTALFNDDTGIILTDRTYRLTMDFIPAQSIITLTLSSITDGSGNPLISSTVTLNDDDDDGMADDWETAYGISSTFSDADSDGVENRLEFESGTDPLSTDTDNDGMDDAYEIQNNLNPLADDTNEDADGDGLTNYEEYIGGTGAANSGPEKPSLLSPADNAVNVSLTPLLLADAYADDEDDDHLKTQWQVSTDPSFADEEDVVFELESYEILTSLNLPEFIVDAGRTYYWRVRYFDAQDESSPWSDPSSFSTQAADPEDADENGIPDVQQVVDALIDLNEDDVMDVATDLYKMVDTGSMQFAMEASNNVQSIEYMKYINPDDIADNLGKPSNLPFGLIQFRIKVNSAGDAAIVRIYFSEAVGSSWYKYDLVNGWTEYSADYPDNVQFSADGRSVLLRLVDGGDGDSDGKANGVIVDPSGPGALIAALTSPGSSVGGGGGGGCFIATAAFGTQLEKHVQILRDFRDFYLLKSHAGTAFVRAYYKYSPPIADRISGNETLRAIVRAGLMPLIAYGYMAVYLTPFQQCMLVFVNLCFLAWVSIQIYRHYSKKRPSGY